MSLDRVDRTSNVDHDCRPIDQSITSRFDDIPFMIYSHQITTANRREALTERIQPEGLGLYWIATRDVASHALSEAIFGQPEVGIGLVPGGGSTQRLPSLVGRARALEILLGGEDFSAATAERFGWINRALPAEELGPFVEKLALRIAAFPTHTIAHIKAAVNQGVLSSIPSDLLAEAHQADLCVADDVTRQRVAEGQRLGLETPDGELQMQAILERLTPPSEGKI